MHIIVSIRLTTNMKMYLLGLMCLVAASTALPVIPEAPVLPGRIVLMIDPPKLEAVHEEKKDENEALPSKEIILRVLPEAPVLPSLDLTILREIVKPEDVKISEEIKDEKTESPKEELNKEEEKIEDIAVKVEKDGEVKVEEIKIEPAKSDTDEDNKIVLGFTIPSPPIINNIMSSINKIPISLPSLSNINWPFQWPSFFTRPRVIYPGYIEEKVL